VPVSTSGGFIAKTTWRTNYDAAPGFIVGLLAATLFSFLRRGNKYVARYLSSLQ
jgi:hypothetical protein